MRKNMAQLPAFQTILMLVHITYIDMCCYIANIEIHYGWLIQIFLKNKTVVEYMLQEYTYIACMHINGAKYSIFTN